MCGPRDSAPRFAPGATAPTRCATTAAAKRGVSPRPAIELTPSAVQCCISCANLVTSDVTGPAALHNLLSLQMVLHSLFGFFLLRRQGNSRQTNIQWSRCGCETATTTRSTSGGRQKNNSSSNNNADHNNNNNNSDSNNQQPKSAPCHLASSNRLVSNKASSESV